MVLPYEIAADEVDAKSPISEALMGGIKDDLDDLDSRAAAVGAFDYQFKLIGNLDAILGMNAEADSAESASLDDSLTPRRKRVDGGLISKSTTFQECRILLEDFGKGGTVEVDVRRYTKPNAQITSVVPLFQASIQSIARVGSSINTQSIARVTPQISTQSVARWKSSLNIQSIVFVGYHPSTGDKLWRINLDSAPDSDYAPASSGSGSFGFIPKTVNIASASDANNNGNFTIYSYNEDGGNNVIVVNNSGVEQSSAAGTLDLNAWVFTFTNPVSSEFAVGEIATLANHTSSANDGQLIIYKVNEGGNNLIFLSQSMVAQAGVAGNVNCNRWVYAFSSAAPADYVVGENALMAGHSSSENNGTFRITGVNNGGNNVVVYNSSGVVQGGAAGTVDTMRWTIGLVSDPSSDVEVDDYVILTSTTSDSNKGFHVVKEVNRSAGTNLIVHGTLTAQAGAAGTVTTVKKKVTFASDQSATITTDSRIKIVNCPVVDEDDYDVLEVNRGGGSNYNVVINTWKPTSLPGAAGRVALESKSLFDTRPSITKNDYREDFDDSHGQISSNAVFNATRKTVTAGTLIMLDILSIPRGAKNLTVQLL